MAAEDPSTGMWRGRGRLRQTMGSPHSRNRSVSRQLPGRRRATKPATRNRNCSPGALQEGDLVEVYSRTAQVWACGEVIGFEEENFVKVEYLIDELWHCKMMHRFSEHLVIFSTTHLSELLPEEHDPGAGARLRARTLDEYLRQRPDVLLPEAYRSSRMDFVPDGLSALCIRPQDRLYVLEHQSSGIVIWRDALNISGTTDEQLVVLYHYTTRDSFLKICRSNKLWATLLAHGPPNDTSWGDGCYATSKAPDDFGSSEQVLVNNFTNTPDKTQQRAQIKDYHGRAGFCVPLLVPQSMATRVTKQPIVIRDEHGERTLQPGIMRNGQRVRADRDIWVIRLKDLGGRVQHLNPEDAKWMALMALGRMAKPGDAVVLEGLVKCLNDTVASVRREAFSMVGNLASQGDAAALEALTKCLDDTDALVRREAVYALRTLAIEGDAVAREAVTKASLYDTDSEVRSMAVWALGRLASQGDAAVLEALTKCLDDTHALVRREAREVLGKLASQGDAAVLRP